MGLGLGRHANRTLACLLVIMAALHLLRAQDPEAAANQKKARATLDAMVAALGGERWLTLTDTMQQGRTSGFYLGKPTGMTSEFYEIQKFPDQTRVELGKKRDVFEIISGDQAWEITYKGKRELPKDQVQELIRRRDHSIPTAMRVWLNDPRTVLIYGGQNLVERHLADQTTLINAENDSIPQTQLMIDHQVGGRQHGSSRGLEKGKGIAPTENRRAGLCCRSTRLAN